MPTAVNETPSAAPPRPLRLGVVSFVNTLPLIDGLDAVTGVELKHSVPSRLVDQLVAGEVDVALCSSIDYQRAASPLVILPVGQLGCDGPTLTVRLYSAEPLERITRVYCDTDSHTSVALMRIILKERFGITPELIDYDAREHVAENRSIDWPPAMLLIGDKVVTDSPPAVRYPHQLDLGAAWRELTGRSFVFAMWMARADADGDALRLAAALLDRQRRHNVERVDLIVRTGAEPRHWPRDLASEYLAERLRFELTDKACAAVELFYEKAAAHGLIRERRPLRFFTA